MASFTDSQGFKIPRPFVNAGGVNIAAIATNTVLTMKSSTIQKLTNGSGSGKDLTLPAAQDGAIFWVGNAGAHDIVVKNAAAATIATVAQNKAALVASDGATWTAVFVS